MMVGSCSEFQLHMHVCTHTQEQRSGTIIGKNYIIKTHGHVSVAKKDMRHTSVLFIGAAKSPFSTPRISITAGPISINYALCIHDFAYQI